MIVAYLLPAAAVFHRQGADAISLHGLGGCHGIEAWSRLLKDFAQDRFNDIDAVCSGKVKADRHVGFSGQVPF